MNRLIIIGASGHGKVVAEIAELNGYRDIIFLDDNQEIKECAGYPMIGPSAMVPELDGDVFIAIGNATIRKTLMERYSDRNYPALIHPSAVISKRTQVGKGTVVMAGTVINADAYIGKGCIINTSGSVDHDCIISDYVHVAVGARVCGTVTIEECVWIGAGAIVSNNLIVKRNVIIGAGAVLVRDITEQGTYVGVPAEKI